MHEGHNGAAPDNPVQTACRILADYLANCVMRDAARRPSRVTGALAECDRITDVALDRLAKDHGLSPEAVAALKVEMMVHFQFKVEELTLASTAPAGEPS